MKTVKDIVKEYLENNNYDGLYSDNGGCACHLSDLIPCGNEKIEQCRPGYKSKCDCGDRCLYHIGANVEEQKVKK